MPKHFLARVLLFLAVPQALAVAPAVAAPQPPDVVNDVGSTSLTYTLPTFASGTNPNLPIDASVTVPWRGLTALNTSQSETGLRLTGPVQNETDPDIYEKCFADGGTAGECKFRTHISFEKVSQTDFIRNWGQKAASHLHVFGGALCVSPFVTYYTLRNCPDSSSAGGVLNNSVYWMPTVGLTNPFGDGKNYALRPATIPEYYRNDGQQPHRTAHIPNGLRFVTGKHMDFPNWNDPNYNLAGAIATANAQPGTAGRYRLLDTQGRTSADVTWLCFKNTGTSSNNWVQVNASGTAAISGGGGGAQWFWGADGTDPWAGGCTGTATRPGYMNAQLNMASCWDGHNIHSDTGYRHVTPTVWDNVAGKWTCGQNQYQIVTIVLNVFYYHTGPADYQRWRLSSDDAYGVKKYGTAASASSGESFHADFMDGWKTSIRYLQEENCGAVENHVGHLCKDSRISSTDYLLSYQAVSPTGRNPQVDTTLPDSVPQNYISNSASKMFLAPTTTLGPHTGTVH